MNWILVGISFSFGILVTGIVFLVVWKPRQKWGICTVIIVSLCVIGYATMGLFVSPSSKSQKTLNNLEESLSEVPAYEHISLHDAETYQRIKDVVRESLTKGESKAQIIQRVRLIVSELVEKYLPISSDKALLGYMSVVIMEIEELALQSPELCYKFLFPKQYGAIDVTKYISPETQKADLDALAAVIRTGAEAPVSVQSSTEYDALIQNIIINLHEMYGDDALLLENPHAQGIDRRQFCRIMVALYREILKLPEKESCLVLRNMITTK